jgi:hypothetical protein
MGTCPVCSCCLEIDHPGQGYCPFCNMIVDWVPNEGWVPRRYDEED